MPDLCYSSSGKIPPGGTRSFISVTDSGIMAWSDTSLFLSSSRTSALKHTHCSVASLPDCFNPISKCSGGHPNHTADPWRARWDGMAKLGTPQGLGAHQQYLPEQTLLISFPVRHLDPPEVPVPAEAPARHTQLCWSCPESYGFTAGLSYLSRRFLQISFRCINHQQQFIKYPHWRQEGF